MAFISVRRLMNRHYQRQPHRNTKASHSSPTDQMYFLIRQNRINLRNNLRNKAVSDSHSSKSMFETTEQKITTLDKKKYLSDFQSKIQHMFHQFFILHQSIDSLRWLVPHIEITRPACQKWFSTSGHCTAGIFIFFSELHLLLLTYYKGKLQKSSWENPEYVWIFLPI